MSVCTCYRYSRPCYRPDRHDSKIIKRGDPAKKRKSWLTIQRKKIEQSPKTFQTKKWIHPKQLKKLFLKITQNVTKKKEKNTENISPQNRVKWLIIGRTFFTQKCCVIYANYILVRDWANFWEVLRIFTSWAFRTFKTEYVIYDIIWNGYFGKWDGISDGHIGNLMKSTMESIMVFDGTWIMYLLIDKQHFLKDHHCNTHTAQ